MNTPTYIKLSRAVADARCTLSKDVHGDVRLSDLVAILKQVDDGTRAINTLKRAGYTDHGGALWKPPLGQRPPQEELLVAIMVQADDGQTGFERCRAMLRPVLEKLGVVTL